MAIELPRRLPDLQCGGYQNPLRKKTNNGPGHEKLKPPLRQTTRKQQSIRNVTEGSSQYFICLPINLRPGFQFQLVNLQLVLLLLRRHQTSYCYRLFKISGNKIHLMLNYYCMTNSAAAGEPSPASCLGNVCRPPSYWKYKSSVSTLLLLSLPNIPTTSNHPIDCRQGLNNSRLQLY